MVKWEVQSVIFKRNKWTKEQASKWLKEHKYKHIFRGKSPKDISKNYLRYRQHDPNRYKKFSSKKLGKGIELILGYL